MSLVNDNNLETVLNGVKTYVDLKDAIRPNWNQNDPTALDYVLNRPFYGAREPVTIEFTPANTTDYWQKASDLTPPYEDVYAGSYVASTYGTDYPDTFVGSSSTVHTYEDGNVVIFGDVMIVYVSGEYTATSGYAEAGIYFSVKEDGNIYLKSLTFTDGELKTLDEKYIPDTIARTEDAGSIIIYTDASEIGLYSAGAPSFTEITHDRGNELYKAWLEGKHIIVEGMDSLNNGGGLVYGSVCGITLNSNRSSGNTSDDCDYVFWFTVGDAIKSYTVSYS